MARKLTSPAPGVALPGGLRGVCSPGENFDFQKPGIAISCDLRVKFMKRTTKYCVICGNLVHLLVLIGKQVEEFSVGTIIATLNWEGTNLIPISLSHAMRPGLKIRHFWVAKLLFLTIIFL